MGYSAFALLRLLRDGPRIRGFEAPPHIACPALSTSDGARGTTHDQVLTRRRLPALPLFHSAPSSAASLAAQTAPGRRCPARSGGCPRTMLKRPRVARP